MSLKKSFLFCASVGHWNLQIIACISVEYLVTSKVCIELGSCWKLNNTLDMLIGTCPTTNSWKSLQYKAITALYFAFSILCKHSKPFCQWEETESLCKCERNACKNWKLIFIYSRICLQIFLVFKLKLTRAISELVPKKYRKYGSI